MKPKSRFVLVALALTFLIIPGISPAVSQDNDDWGWQFWGWTNGPNMMPGRGMMGHMANIDSDGDGLIGDGEAAAMAEAAFSFMDGDGDGQLSDEEFLNGHMGWRWGRALNRERQKVMQDFRKTRFIEMDADKNSKVSQAEFMASAKLRFQAADSDKDGKVTPWEFHAQRWH